MSTPFVGIDLTAGVRPSDVAALDLAGEEVVFARGVSDDDLTDILHALKARIIAVDSPMGLPAGLCCLEVSCTCMPTGGTGRSAERELAKLGIPCFWTTKKSILRAMVYRAIELKTRWEADGFVVLEVFPYAVKRLLLGPDLPKKNTPAGITRLVDGARIELPGGRWPVPWTPTHDQLDALYCAMTARLHALGRTESIGDPSEVPIVIPARRI